MRKANEAIEFLRRQGDTLKKVLESLPEDEWLLKDEDETVTLAGGKITITYRKPTAETLLRYIEDTNRLGMVEALRNLLKACLKSYKIVTPQKTVDSDQLPKSERIDVLMRTAHPSLLLWIVTVILPPVPLPEDTGGEEMEEIPVE